MKNLILAASIIVTTALPLVSYAESEILQINYAKPTTVHNTLDPLIKPIMFASCPAGGVWVYGASINIVANAFTPPEGAFPILSMNWVFEGDAGKGNCQPPISNVTTEQLKNAQNQWDAQKTLDKTPKISYFANGQLVFSYKTDLTKWNKITWDKKTYYFIGCADDPSDKKNRFIRCCFETDQAGKRCLQQE